VRVVTEARSDTPSARGVLRVVTIVVLSALALYLLYLLRRPITWIVLAGFVAVCASGPINFLSRRVPRAAAIGLVFAGSILAPLIMGLILVPPVVRQGVKLVNDLPGYVRELQQTFQENPQLRELDAQYDITGKLQNVAEDLIRNFGQAATALVDIGAGVVSSLFALFTILVMAIFLVSRGPVWVEQAVAMRPPHQAEAMRRTLQRISVATGAYVGGALLQALVAGVIAFIVLSILGVPSPLALSLVVAVLDVIPLVGATLGGIIVGVVTLFGDFPIDTIVWAIFALAYQQFENYVVQPRIQSRAVDLDAFVIVVAALFGGTLAGILGALLAIPFAAAIQIAVREFLAYRRRYAAGEFEDEPPGVVADSAP
jgi:predicted PurR-regulated permease PerM